MCVVGQLLLQAKDLFHKFHSFMTKEQLEIFQLFIQYFAMYFFAIIALAAASRLDTGCVLKNNNNTILVAQVEQPYYLSLNEYFSGLGLQFTITNSGSINKVRLINPLEKSTVSNWTNIIPASMTIVAAGFMNVGLNPYFQSSQIGLLASDGNQYYIFSGIVDQDGMFQNLTNPFNISKSSIYSCFSMVTLQSNLYLVGCINSTNFVEYQLINSSSSTSTSTTLNMSQPIVPLKAFFTQRLSLYFNQSQIMFQQIFVNGSSSALIVGVVDLPSYNMAITYQKMYSQSYINIIMGLDGTIFYLNSSDLYINGNPLTQLQLRNLKQFTIQNYANVTHLYGIAVASSDAIAYFIYNSQKPQIQSIETIVGAIPTQFKQDQVTLQLYDNTLFYFTTIGILYYELDVIIALVGYYNIQLSYVPSISWSSQILGVFINGSYFSIQYNEPKVYFEISSIGNTSLTVTANTSNGLNCQVRFSVQTVDTITSTLCPICTQVGTLNSRKIEYPNYQIVTISDHFVGENLNYSISPSPENTLVWVDTPSIQLIQAANIVFTAICDIRLSQILIQQDISNLVIVKNNNSNATLGTYQLGQELLEISCELYFSQYYIAMSTGQSILLFSQKLNAVNTSTFTYINVSQQFSYNPTVVDLEVVYDILYIITTPPLLSKNNSFYAYNITNISNVQLIYQVTNQSPRALFSNVIDYDQLLFIDNTDQLLIIYNQGLNFQIFNSFNYSIISTKTVAIGLLKSGIFIAMVTTSGASYLDLIDPLLILPVRFDSSFKAVSVYLKNLTFPTPLISTFTSYSFYIMMANSANQSSCQSFKVRGSPYNSFFNNSGPISYGVSYMSGQIRGQSEFIVLDLVTNGLFYQGQTGINVYVKTLPILMNENQGKFEIVYNASSNGCAQTLVEIIQVENDQVLIVPEEETVKFSVQKSDSIQLQPQQLFKGSMMNYEINCTKCISITYQNPIDLLVTLMTFQTLAASNSNNGQLANMLYFQNNTNLWAIEVGTYSLQQLYSFPENLTNCIIQFVDIQSNNPVSVCEYSNASLSIMFSVVNSQLYSQIINLSGLLEGFYQNGVIQIITSTQYQAAYVVLNSSGMFYTPIYTQNGSFTAANPLNISFTSESQIFGISYVPNVFSQIFYTLVITASPFQTPTVSNEAINMDLKMPNYNIIQVLQIGFTLHPSIEGSSSEQWLVLAIQTDIQPFVFIANFTGGQFRNFNKQQCKYVQQSLNYQLYAYQNVLININTPLPETFLVNIYGDFSNNIDQCKPAFQFPIIGFINLTSPSGFASKPQVFLLNGYLVAINEQTTDSYELFIVQTVPYLPITFELDRSSFVGVSAFNPYSQSFKAVSLNTSFTIWAVPTAIAIVILISIGAYFWCAKFQKKAETQQEQIELKGLI